MRGKDVFKQMAVECKALIVNQLSNYECANKSTHIIIIL